MTESPAPEGPLGDELRSLGQNLLEVMRAAWAREGRQRLQGDVETAVDGLIASLGSAARDFTASEAGQRVEQELRQLSERVESGELEAEVRRELGEALRRANAALAHAAERLREHGVDAPGTEGEG